MSSMNMFSIRGKKSFWCTRLHVCTNLSCFHTSMRFLLHAQNGQNFAVLSYSIYHLLTRELRVDDILEGRSEQDKVLFSSEDFVLLPDMKWDLHTVQSLYLVAISRDPTLRSLRDLRSKHVPLLKEIRDVACNVTNQKFGISKGGLRMWIHYQPSYCEHMIFLSPRVNIRR
jgi:hypothetical protein